MDAREGGIDNECTGNLTAHIDTMLRDDLHIEQLAR